MNSPAGRQILRRRRQQRGFSLIELGIVIAVIAVLASVVIFGRGFIAAGRITKAVEGMNTIRKSSSTFAGLQGGALNPSTASELTALSNRQLLPQLTGVGNAAVWDVSGSGADAIKITNLRYGQLPSPNGGAPTNAVAIVVGAPVAAMTQDVWNSVAKDNNLVKTAATIGGAPACATPATGPTNAATAITICFFL